jgi:hypothetical protein
MTMGTPPNAAATPAVDAENPWLGLASFTEETRGYFHGREEEVAELARRVQRKRLTVLFGQSGLGKTSILRAGLVPRLRGQGYCPIYVRIDYGRDSPPPAEQIKQAIARTARRSGEWTQVGVAEAGESLWEFLHHRDDVLRDESGATLIPLLIFDQFEEIFTLGQSDDFGRARAATFVEDLADLVENRPPKALEAKLEADESAAEKFDFARSDYRVLIALREDYLAPLEGLKGPMPSITQNRLRLAPMTGTQALAAVTGPGGRLVTEEVAEAIVRFVAGGAELANAEVEPSLLSLICRELNDTRIAQGRAEISLDLLDGSRTAILSNFYERALADQPAPVRRVIEDELLTDSGFRENIAEERMQASLAAAGAGPEALALLVNRRLLRIEERLDIRRVELTHDVLCSVVKASRDLRHEREARDATERRLAEQQSRELAARHALVRARQVATVCIVLAVAAVGAAGYAVLSGARAKRAEAAAVETRRVAERARGEAEHLLGYLNDDFATELEGFGRLGLIEEIDQKVLDYYRSLPESLQTSDTRASAALAQVRFGVALIAQARLAEAGKMLGAAVASLKSLRAAGDTSDRVAIGLSLGLGSLGDLEDRQGRDGLPLSGESEEVLRPYYDAPNASAAVRRTYGLMAESLATYQGFSGIPMFERAKQAFASLGALELRDVHAAADYAQAASYEGVPLFFGERDRDADLRKIETEAEQLAERVLEVRPGHMVALRAQVGALGWLAGIKTDELHMREAAALSLRSAEADAVLVRLDPTNSDDRQSYAQAIRWAAVYLAAAGENEAALRLYARAMDVVRAERDLSPFNLAILHGWTREVARIEFDDGDARAGASLEAARALTQRIDQKWADDALLRVNADGLAALEEAELAYLAHDLAHASPLARVAVEKLAHGQGNSSLIQRSVEDRQMRAAMLVAQIEYDLGDYAAAARDANAAGERMRNGKLVKPFEQQREARSRVLEALSLARLGQLAEARAAIAPALALERRLYARNKDHEMQRVELASALLAAGLADPAQRAGDLAESDRILKALPATMQRRLSVRRWADELRAELNRHG